MHAICLSLLVTLVVADNMMDPQQPRRIRCPGGYEEGAEAVLGRYWYKCHNGELEPKGCIDAHQQRVDLWATTDSVSQDYRFECALDSQGFLQFNYKACLYQGRPFGVNERWNDDKYVYICRKEGDHLRADVDGCVDGGHEVSINQKVKKGDFLYQCKQNENGTCSMCPVGCVKVDREYLIGQTLEDGQFWYSCEKADNRITLRPMGCVSQGKRLSDNDHFVRGDTAYECLVNKDEIKERAIGCNGRDDRGTNVEKPAGAIWTEGDYDVECRVDKATDRSTKAPVRCIYRSSTGPVSLNGGCYRVVDQTVIGCLKDASGIRLKVYGSFGGDQTGAAMGDGLTFC